MSALYPAAAFNDRDFDLDGDSLDMDSDDDELDDINHCTPDQYLQYDPTPDTPYPKPDWITFKELKARKRGFASTKQPTKRPNMYWFQRYAKSSLWMIQRLQVEKRLEGHSGCVNSLGFNSSAGLLCSGGDDLSICIWNWQHPTKQLKARLNSGHAQNVFQSQFCKSDTSIVTSSRDGTVRLLDLQTSESERIMSSSGEIGNLTFIDENTFITCGTNASVHQVDLRTNHHEKLFTVRNPKNNRACPLHSINAHPIDKNVVAVTGSSAYVLLYDLRRPPREMYDTEMRPKTCLGAFDNPNYIVTSTAFNSTGDKLLVSYNYDDLYVFDMHSCLVVHKYQGHRNKKTIKGCAWFGDKYVLSGSDDGHIYGWDLESEHIVCFLQGDTGIVNTLCVHPTLPILASSGLDHDVKIWEPLANTWPQTMRGIKPQICKNFLRRKLADERRFGRIDIDDSDYMESSSEMAEEPIFYDLRLGDDLDDEGSTSMSDGDSDGREALDE